MTSKRARWPPLFITFLLSSWLVTSVYQVLAKIYVRFFYYGITLKAQRKDSSPQFTQPNAKHTRKQVGICEEQLLFWFLLFSLRCNVIHSNKWQYTSVKENQCFKIINYNCLTFTLDKLWKDLLSHWLWVKFYGITIRGSTLGIFGWGFAARTLETLPYTRASSAKVFHPILR